MLKFHSDYIELVPDWCKATCSNSMVAMQVHFMKTCCAKCCARLHASVCQITTVGCLHGIGDFFSSLPLATLCSLVSECDLLLWFQLTMLHTLHPLTEVDPLHDVTSRGPVAINFTIYCMQPNNIMKSIAILNELTGCRPSCKQSACV